MCAPPPSSAPGSTQRRRRRRAPRAGPGQPPGTGTDPGRSTGTDPRRSTGRRGELLAAEHMGRLGFEVLGRNVRSRQGEIDLVCFDGHTLVFAEVKTRRERRTTGAGQGAVGTGREPLLWLGHAQRRRVRRLAAAWLASGSHPRPTARAIRFDAIGVTLEAAGGLLRIDHVAGAW